MTKSLNKSNEEFIILMACSLNSKKGMHEFIECARRLPHLKFELILNARSVDIAKYFANCWLPANLKIYPAQSVVRSFNGKTSQLIKREKIAIPGTAGVTQQYRSLKRWLNTFI